MPHDATAQYEMIVAELEASLGATHGKMFGMPCLKLGGKAFAGLYREAMVFKLRGDAHAQALALPGARLFDPSERGRPMKEWVEVPSEHAAHWLSFGQQALAGVAEAG
jgi:hypothetical protein